MSEDSRRIDEHNNRDRSKINRQGETAMSAESQACKNTDREIWRGPDEGGGDFYADSLHITKEGALGINCGGYVVVMPIREWHRLGAIGRRPIDEIKST